LPSRWIPGDSQKVVPAGFESVSRLRLSVVWTTTAPAGAAAGPDNAFRFSQTLAGGVFGALTGVAVTAVDDDAAGPVVRGCEWLRKPPTPAVTSPATASTATPASTCGLWYHAGRSPGGLEGPPGGEALSSEVIGSSSS